MYWPLASTAVVEVKIGGPAQTASSGPKSRKVMAPVGLPLPARVATSEMGYPTVVAVGAPVGVNTGNRY